MHTNGKDGSVGAREEMEAGVFLYTTPGCVGCKVKGTLRNTTCISRVSWICSSGLSVLQGANDMCWPTLNNNALH